MNDSRLTALPNKHYSGHRRATEIEGDQRTRGKEIWKKKNVDSRFQVQLEEDGGGSTGQSWMEISSLWPMLHLERQRLIWLTDR